MRFSIVWHDREGSQGVRQSFLKALPRYSPRLVERNTTKEHVAPRRTIVRPRRARNTPCCSTWRPRPWQEVVEERRVETPSPAHQTRPCDEVAKKRIEPISVTPPRRIRPREEFEEEEEEEQEQLQPRQRSRTSPLRPSVVEIQGIPSGSPSLGTSSSTPSLSPKIRNTKPQVEEVSQLVVVVGVHNSRRYWCPPSPRSRDRCCFSSFEQYSLHWQTSRYVYWQGGRHRVSEFDGWNRHGGGYEQS